MHLGLSECFSIIEFIKRDDNAITYEACRAILHDIQITLKTQAFFQFYINNGAIDTCYIMSFTSNISQFKKCT